LEGDGECGNEVELLLVREIQSLDILSELPTSEMPGRRRFSYAFCQAGINEYCIVNSFPETLWAV